MPDPIAPQARDFALSLEIADREHRLGHYEAARGIYRVVLGQCPGYPAAFVDLSRTLFALRQWPEAWAAFGRRFETFEGRTNPALVDRVGLSKTPRMAAGGKPRLLAVISEGGLGDIILFSRFVPRMMANGPAVRLIAPRGLLPLLRTLDPAPELAPADQSDAGAGCDAWAPLMDLPVLLGLAEADLSAPAATLRADSGRVARWRAWLEDQRGDRRGPIIAIAWRGAAENRAAAQRSARLADFAALAANPEAILVCLQKDATEDEIQASGLAGQILRPGAGFDEDGAFLDSAALLMSVDRLVSIDTALVHLAGALARPCDVLLGENPDWRWLAMAPENVWHPTVRVWRCGAGETFAGLATRCADLATAGASTSEPRAFVP